MKHNWFKDGTGRTDVWRLETDRCSGPQCFRCRQFFCDSCEPDIYSAECPNGQLSFFEEDNQ